MGNQIVLLSPDTEPLTITRAWVGDNNGRPEPYAMIDGRLCFIDTKPSLLDLGIASCVPVEPSPAQDWPHHVEVSEEGFPTRRTIADATTNAQVLAAAKTWAQISAADQIEIGQSLL